MLCGPPRISFASASHSTHAHEQCRNTRNCIYNKLSGVARAGPARNPIPQNGNSSHCDNISVHISVIKNYRAGVCVERECRIVSHGRRCRVQAADDRSECISMMEFVCAAGKYMNLNYSKYLCSSAVSRGGHKYLHRAIINFKDDTQQVVANLHK